MKRKRTLDITLRDVLEEDLPILFEHLSDPVRPLYAIVAEHNAASRRVLQKCGFGIIDRNYEAADCPGPEVVDYPFRLRETAVNR
jgi:RimJ/RimL family protein N-acetyltransferase